jgi:predicted AlkP superfamily pyrophosphatase or phosphodiesterase
MRFGLVLSVLILTAGCFSPHYIRSDSNSHVLPHPVPGLTDHVILVSIDGLRPDAIAKFEATTLNRLIQEGGYTLSASTIFPSKTLPSHTSMLTGQPPGIHHVSWNNKLSLNRKDLRVPTVFGVLRSKGFVTAAFFSKAKFSTLQQRDDLDYSEAPGGWWGRWSADRVVRDVEAYLAAERPNLLFVHFSDTDSAGHDAGWMSAKYGKALQAIDASVAKILAAAERTFGPDNLTMIITADHGGHDRNHGSQDPRDITIPWIAWGRATRPGPLTGNLKTMDTASTILWLFQVPEPTDWAGNPVVEAFRQDQGK